MKRALVLGGLTALLSIPALASGQVAVDRYVGDFDGQPDSRIRIDVSFADGKRTISLIKAKDFALACNGGVTVSRRAVSLTGGVGVRKSGSFKVADDNGATTFRARGAVKPTKTVGSFRFFGAVESSGGVTRECDSGRLLFVAR